MTSDLTKILGAKMSQACQALTVFSVTQNQSRPIFK